MDKKYLGEVIVPAWKTKYKNYDKQDWALFWMAQNGFFDGEAQKQWLLDQIAQILNGTEIIIKKASWSDGSIELRFTLANESNAYKKWVSSIANIENLDEGCSMTTEWETGVCP